MIKKRHKTKAELLRELNHAARYRRNAYSASYSGLSIHMAHILIFRERWTPMQVKKLLDAITAGLDDESFNIEAANARMKEKTGLWFDVVEHRKDGKARKTYRNMISSKISEAEDEIVVYSRKWCLLAYSYMMDNGFGKKRITRINDAMMQSLRTAECGFAGSRTRDLRNDLIGANFYIEMPKEINWDGDIHE